MATRARSAVSRDLKDMYAMMVLIREFEETVQKSYERGLVHGSTHLCQGQEAVAVGFAAAMGDRDVSTYTYRGHGHALARGMDPQGALAEIMGRLDGVNRGKGGSMHLTDSRLGLMGSFAIVGAGLPVAVGLARAAQLRREPLVSVTFFGDGATNIGAFHEALNLAAVWAAPVVFVCENNLYGEYSSLSLTTPVIDLAVRDGAYGMPSVIVDGNDVLAVVKVAEQTLERARSGGGPTLVECKTYRHKGHSRADPGKYRPEAEVQAWLARDPLVIARDHLIASGQATKAELDAIDAQVAEGIAAAAMGAAAAAVPGSDEIARHVYA